MGDTAPSRVRGYGSNRSTGFRIRSPDQGLSVYSWLHYPLTILYVSFRFSASARLRISIGLLNSGGNRAPLFVSGV